MKKSQEKKDIEMEIKFNKFYLHFINLILFNIILLIN